MPEQWTRDQARRLLVERGRAKVEPELTAWLKALDPKSPGYETLRLEALWTYQAINAPAIDLLTALLHSADPRIRAAATRVVPDWKASLQEPVALLNDRVGDNNPRVRLETVRALAEFPALPAAESALAATDKPVDLFLDYAIWLTARELAPVWLPELQAERFTFGGNIPHLIHALSALGSPAVVKPLLTLLEQGKIPAGQVENAQTLIAALGDPPALGDLLSVILREGALPPPRRVGLLETLARTAAQRKVIPAGDTSRIAPLFASTDEPLVAAAVHAAGEWKAEPLRPRIIALATGPDVSPTVRAAALNALARLAGPEDRRAIESVIDSGPSSQAKALAVAAYLDLDPKAGIPRIAQWLARVSPADAADAGIVLARVRERRDAPRLLALAITNNKQSIEPTVARLCVAELRRSGGAISALVASIEKAGRLAPVSKAMSPAEMNELLADVTRIGDPARGESVFRRKELGCQKCHSISGAGGVVGPSLESIGASAQTDYLLDSILDPNKAVKENYHSLVVATDDGKLYTGIKVRQTDTELILRDADDREIAIPLASIEDQKPSGSLMPAGLVDNLSRADLVDLVRFLSQLGKVGPYATSTERIFRRWQLLNPSSAGTPLDDPKLPWRPAYTTVAGFVPISEWNPSTPASQPTGTIGVARTQFQVSAAGPIQLRFQSLDHTTVQIDGRAIDPTAKSATVVVTLPVGTHTLDLLVDLAHHTDPIRVTLDDAPNSPARAQVILGK
jgi:putative heme-binding domain-containing protein